MKPNYVAQKSSWGAVKAWHILLFFLIIPIVVMIFEIIAIRKYRLEFYDDKIVIKSGWLNTRTQSMVFMGVTSTSITKSLWGSIFNYGTVNVDAIGKWDVASTTYIKDPEKLDEYLQTRIMQKGAINPNIHMGI